MRCLLMSLVVMILFHPFADEHFVGISMKAQIIWRNVILAVLPPMGDKTTNSSGADCLTQGWETQAKGWEDSVKKNSKKPTERRKELVDTAARLFVEKGYEATSVRDILDAVGGAPGMFYYYFKSKQDIYVAVMEDFISERMARKCEVMENDEQPFGERVAALRSLVADDVSEYVRSFNPESGESVSDASYKLWDMVQMLDRMAGPYAKLILEGVRTGKIENRLGVDEDNAEACALFVLYGLWGVMYDGRFASECNQHTPDEAFKIMQELFH